MPFTRRSFLAITLLGSSAVLAGCSGLPTAGPAASGGVVRLAPDTRLILVRHADRAGEDLTEAGIARAAALPATLAGIPLDAILSPGIKRNLDTAAPLVAARDLPVTRLAQERPAPLIASRFGAQSVIWIGNKGNLQSIWDDLGLDGAPPLDYGDLFIVTADSAGVLSVDRRRWEA